ncbi:MAG: hypothetical protein VR71_11715 [Roseovarius sp. BRH_c41]|uniref:hypothetical protein n=1 Tax=Roseovarius sp. BRH_c41 TaxID=1629709 RepID=UPI0005F2405A|nr:hypothetical protein [Roseovarius sp. BRH_c41]KJS43123.1 MAG: hypothetical protein VR71_11715 [Roseovarius sp. BRH_c41]
MTEFLRVTGPAVALIAPKVGTDMIMIMPKQFMNGIDRAGLPDRGSAEGRADAGALRRPAKRWRTPIK